MHLDVEERTVYGPYGVTIPQGAWTRKNLHFQEMVKEAPYTLRGGGGGGWGVPSSTLTYSLVCPSGEILKDSV